MVNKNVVCPTSSFCNSLVHQLTCVYVRVCVRMCVCRVGLLRSLESWAKTRVAWSVLETTLAARHETCTAHTPYGLRDVYMFCLQKSLVAKWYMFKDY